MLPSRAHARGDTRATVLIAARDARLRKALWLSLEDEPEVAPLAVTAEFADLGRLLRRLHPDVVLVDEATLGGAGVPRMKILARAAPRSSIVVVGMHDHPAYLTWIRNAGAADYVRLDDAERMGRAVVEAGTGAA